MSARSNKQHRDLLIPFFILAFLITWGIGALAIFLPAQLQALVEARELARQPVSP